LEMMATWMRLARRTLFSVVWLVKRNETRPESYEPVIDLSQRKSNPSDWLFEFKDLHLLSSGRTMRLLTTCLAKGPNLKILVTCSSSD
jgi:hypothetical protein